MLSHQGKAPLKAFSSFKFHSTFDVRNLLTEQIYKFDGNKTKSQEENYFLALNPLKINIIYKTEIVTCEEPAVVITFQLHLSFWRYWSHLLPLLLLDTNSKDIFHSHYWIVYFLMRANHPN